MKIVRVLALLFGQRLRFGRFDVDLRVLDMQLEFHILDRFLDTPPVLLRIDASVELHLEVAVAVHAGSDPEIAAIFQIETGKIGRGFLGRLSTELDRIGFGDFLDR